MRSGQASEECGGLAVIWAGTEGCGPDRVHLRRCGYGSVGALEWAYWRYWGKWPGGDGRRLRVREF